MGTPNTLTYERWLDMYAAPAVSIAISSGDLTSGSSGGAGAGDYELDLTTGSYAVQAHAFSSSLTPARWFETIRTGERASEAVTAEPAEAWEEAELIGAL